MKVLLDFFDAIRKNFWLKTTLSVLFLVSFAISQLVVLKPLRGGVEGQDEESLLLPGDGTGYTAEQLNHFYNQLGDEGCEKYSRYLIWHLMVLDPLMFVVMGTFLVEKGLLSAPRVKPQYVVVGMQFSLITVAADVVDHLVRLRGCWIYPQPMSDWTIQIGSTSLGVALVFIVSVVILLVWWGCESRVVQQRQQVIDREKDLESGMIADYDKEHEQLLTSEKKEGLQCSSEQRATWSLAEALPLQ